MRQTNAVAAMIPLFIVLGLALLGVEGLVAFAGAIIALVCLSLAGAVGGEWRRVMEASLACVSVPIAAIVVLEMTSSTGPAGIPHPVVAIAYLAAFWFWPISAALLVWMVTGQGEPPRRQGREGR